MKHALISGLLAALAATPAFAEVDCLKHSIAVKDAVIAEQSKLLEIVAAEVGSAPDCACEIVKAVIEGTQASSKTVAAIVETAAMAAPEQLRLIAQCAVAAAPDALSEVQAVLAKLDPNSGESGTSAKGAKNVDESLSQISQMPNPLDFPGQGPVGPIPGGPGGFPLIPVLPPIIINPPQVTDVDPG